MLIEHSELNAGQTVYCEICIDGDAELHRGTRFILIDKARDKPIGAGMVLVRGLPRLTAGSKGEVASLLKSVEGEDIPAAFVSLIRIHTPYGVSASFVGWALAMEVDAVDEAARVAEGISIIPLSKDNLLMDDKDIEHWTKRIIKAIKEYHMEHPLEHGPGLTEIISALKSAPAKAAVKVVLKRVVDERLVEFQNGVYHMPDFKPVKEDPLDGLKGRVFAFYLDAGFSPPWLRDAASALKQPETRLKGILRHLCETGYMVKLDKETYLAKEKLGEAAGKAMATIRKHGNVELAEFRDALGCGRSMALCILEYFDRKGWTERRGKVRVKGAKESGF